MTFSEEEAVHQDGIYPPLYITVACHDVRIPKVLVDNESSLNVCPLKLLVSLNLEPYDITPTSKMARGFDGLTHEVLGETELKLTVGPRTVPVKLMVLDIETSFNLLLGRPWIHNMGAVPSMLHQRIKFRMGNNIVTVKGDKTDEVIASIGSLALTFQSFHFEANNYIPEVERVFPTIHCNISSLAETMSRMGLQEGVGIGRYG